MKKQINVVGAVVVRDGTILCAQRSASMSLPGMWEFPGGKIELGETPEQALRRELDEELLCTIDVGDHVETTSYEYDFGGSSQLYRRPVGTVSTSTDKFRLVSNGCDCMGGCSLTQSSC